MVVGRYVGVVVKGYVSVGKFWVDGVWGVGSLSGYKC